MTAPAGTVPVASEPEAAPVPAGVGAATGILLRFVSCGLLSLAAGLTWRLTLAPQRIDAGSALLGIVILLTGFLAGGVLWYLRDSRLRSRRPGSVSDERIIFSFIVFALMPLAVLILVGLIWVLSLLI